MNAAFVNDGRWVAFCSTPDCHSAERLWPAGMIHATSTGIAYGITAAGMLHCGNCGMTSQVDFPDNRDKIDAVLARRPVPQTRNWLPGETVKDLERENKQHGVD